MSAMTNIETNGQGTVTATAIPTSAPVESAVVQSPATDLPILQFGLAGEAVRFAQQRLIANGYRMGFTGQYGSQMKAAIEHFQANYGGLSVDGIIGENTWRALCDQEFPRLGWTFSFPLKNTKYPYSVNMPEFYQGSVGYAVECLQLRLYDNGFFWLYIDGIFGEKTRDAVKAFQARKGLKIDGVVGKDTWRLLGE